MLSPLGKLAVLVWSGLAAVVVLGLGLPTLAKAYNFSLNLAGGDTAARAELDEIFGGNWSITGGQFVGDGYLLDTRSNIKLNLPDDLPVGHVKIRFEAKGIDNAVASSLPAGAPDAYMFGMGNQWCDPCAGGQYNEDCENDRWGLGIKKWPNGLGGMYTNSILAQGWSGMGDGTAVPGAGIGDRFNWEEYTGFYTVQLELHAGASSGELSVWKGNPDAGAEKVLNSPGGITYRLVSNSNRDGMMVGIGAEAPGETSYNGVTLRNVSLLMEEEAAPSGEPGLPPECAEQTDPDDLYGACSCVGGSLNSPVPCEDPPQEGDKKKATFLDQFPFGFDDWEIEWNWTFQDLMKEGDAKDKQTQTPASIELQFAPPAPQEGEEVGAVANALNFRTRPNNLYYAWCLVDGDKVWPMNSVVAGGTRPENASGKSFEDNGCCGPITRTPTTDQDDVDGDGQPEGDGMDDTWEMEKFIGRTINGRTYTRIEEVQPGDDPDTDGFVASNFKNENGQYLTVAPAMVDSKGNTYIPGVTGYFTNIQEYITGTDPLNGDTDGDGNGDEMDYEGVGQSNVPFTIEKPAGPEGYYDIGVSVAGVDSQKKAKLTSTRQRLFIGNDDLIKVSLSANVEVLTFGSEQPVTIQTDLESGPEDNRALIYEWSFNGDSACDGLGYENADLCDAGKAELKLGAGGINLLDLPQPTTEDYAIKVKVHDQVSRDEAEATLVLPVAYSVTLTTACNGRTEEPGSLPANGDQSLIICIAEVEEIAETYELGKLNFVWSLDGVNQESQSGLGKTQFVLTARGESGAGHTVAVKIKDPNRAREFANATRAFGVGGPRVAIIDPAERITYSDEVVPGATRYVAAQPGEAIPFGATQENFIGAAGWIVTWSVNGAVASSSTLSTFEPGFEHLFTFDVPSAAVTGQVYTIGFSVTALDNNPPEAAADSVAVVVGAAGAALGRTDFFSAVAAVFNQIPEVFRSLVMYAGILAGIFFALVFIYPKASRFLENRQPKK